MKRIFHKSDFKVIRMRKGAGCGLITLRSFKRGDFIIEYTGRIITRDEANIRGGKYLFDINSKWSIDGTTLKNLARYINHSCKPNAEVDISKKKIFIYSLRKIKEGTELTYDYGKEYVDEYIKPYGCKCDYCTSKNK